MTDYSTPLSKEAVRYLRQARSVVFRSRDVGDKYETHTIELELESDPKVETSLLVAGNIRSQDAHRSAFDMIHGSQYCPLWCSFARLVRAGDTLTLLWQANCDNQYTKDAGLHSDRLHVAIDRNGKRWGEFVLSVSVCPDNTARMVQP